MHIKDIKIYRRERKVKITFSDNSSIIYRKFGKTLYSGQNVPESLNKFDPILLKIKNKLERLDYFENNSSDINLSEIYAAEKETRQYIGK